MRIEILNKEKDVIKFKFERTQGTYNNATVSIYLKPYRTVISNFTDKQVNKFALDITRKEAMRVFEDVEPMYNEIDELVNFEIENYKLPEGNKTHDLPPTPTREELDSIIDDQLTMMEELSFLKERMKKLIETLKKKGVIDEDFGEDEKFIDIDLDETLSDVDSPDILEEE